MTGAAVTFVALVGFILTWIRICRYMVDNPPRYAPDEYK